MATFSFPYHRVSTEYPSSGVQVQLGRSYTFTAPPEGPDQRKFKLKFPVLKYFLNSDGYVDVTIQPEINLAALEAFYNLHKLHATFTYEHPIYGALAVRFNKPLSIPEGVSEGDGAVVNFELEFVEVPGVADSGVSDMIQIEYQDLPPV